MRTSVSASALMVAVALGVSAQAQPAPERPPSDTTVSEVVVTSAPYAVSLDSTTTHVEIIKADQLDTAPLGGLGDVLSQTPGVRSTFYGPGANRPVIRGLSGPRVLVLSNGVGMVDASTLSPDHAVATDPAQAERIEVLRGPSALAYGGAGIGGVVNVIDERIPTTPAEGGIDGRLVGSLQSGDDARAASGYAKFGTGPWVFAIDGSSRRSDDYHVPVPPVSDRYAAATGLTPIATDVVLNTALDETAYGLGGSYVAANGAYLGASIKRIETEYGVPFAQVVGGAPNSEGPIGIQLSQWRYDVRGQSPIDLGPFDSARVSLGYGDYEHVEILRETGETGTQFLSTGFEGRFELIQRESNGHQGAVGIQGSSRDFEAIGDEAFVPPTKIAQAALFTLQRWDREAWGVDVGLRYEHNDLDSTVGQRGFDNVSGSVGVFYRPTPSVFLAVSAAAVGRAPTEFELFADGPHPGTGGFERGDATLDSERLASIEATARVTAGRFKMEGGLFYGRYTGFIDQQATGEIEDDLPVFQFIQTDAEFVGGELEASYKLWEAGERSLSLEAGYDWVRGSTDVGPPARIPPWSVTGRLAWNSGPLDAKVEVRRVASQGRVTAFELPTDGYTFVNASIETRPFSRVEGVKLFVDGRNLTDVEAREHASFLKDIAPLPGRQIRAGVAYDF